MKNEPTINLALEGSGQHTLIEYIYRDKSNNKKTSIVLLDGRLSKSQIEKMLVGLDKELQFIPGQVGLPDLQNEFEQTSGWLAQDDHVWHELQAIEYRDGRPNGPKAEDVAVAWPTSAEGWNVAEHAARLSGTATLTPGC
ncbi:hypothetical protein ACVIGB_000792 [Bradyrhizobium sp. USDA 4341]